MAHKRWKLLWKYYEYIMTKLKVAISQKCFMYDEVPLKYMMKTNRQSDALVVVFSACTREGVAARYNYVKTIQNIPCNQLFILDDFGEDRRGCFYLGTIPELKVEKACIALVQDMIAKTKAKKVIFCGSCKGGYGALNIGSRFEHATMIIGEPIYRVITEFTEAEALLKYILKDITDDNWRQMDYYLTRQIQNNTMKTTQKIFFFYSTEDEYFEMHTLPLLEDLRNEHYNMEERSAHFDKHADLGLYFSEYLKECIGGVLAE